MILQFASHTLAVRYVAVHPDLRRLLRLLVNFSEREKLPAPVVTGLDRDEGWYKRNGLKTPLFSWHYALPQFGENHSTFIICAVDLRNKHYTKAQKTKVEAWLRETFKSPEYELVIVDHGTGPHYHIARRDFLLRRNWEQMKDKELRDARERKQ